MLKSIYSRIFYFCTVVLVFACAVTGLVVTTLANKKYKKDTFDRFDDTAQILTTRIRYLYGEHDAMPYGEVEAWLQEYTLAYNVDCYLFDENKKLLVRSDYNYTDIPFSDAAKEAAKKEPYCQYGNSSSFAEPTVCYIVNFMLDEDSYYLMLMIPVSNVSEFSVQMITAMIVTVLLIILIAAPLFYLNTAHLLKPLVKITHAAESYAKGDFSVRLEQTGGDSELDYLAETMNRMADFINNNEQSRKNFISNVSHELKTPMTTIGGFVDGILDGTIPPEQEKQYLRTVSSEVQRMSRLVHSMLNISKFEEGSLKPNFISTDITHLLIKTLLLFEKKVDAKHLSVEGLEDCPRMKVECDKDLMQQVFYNLTENAIKFVNDGGTLSVQVSSDEKNAHLCLRNTGEGLTDDEISHVFERFYKTDASRGKDTTGVGLGLSIVSRIIRLHNGKITVKSVPQSYTEFEIILPQIQPAEAQQTEQTAQTRKKK